MKSRFSGITSGVPAAYISAAKMAGVPHVADSAGLYVGGRQVYDVASLNSAIEAAQAQLPEANPGEPGTVVEAAAAVAPLAVQGVEMPVDVQAAAAPTPEV
jgi:hypothetical protein